ncbi:MAG: VWA domain-containing protein [Alphaproteobacteria bacterium]
MNDNSISLMSFTNTLWLWALFLIPLIWLLYFLFFKKGEAGSQARKFADAHLLPHLLLEGESRKEEKRAFLPSLILWSMIWACGILAMAGPRWGYTEIQAFRPAGSLVVLLDMSRSMHAQDISPSRFERAKQEIVDLSEELDGTNIALIVYAAIPHVMTPLSDDPQTMRGFLPSLNPDLIYTQGGNLTLALKRAGEMFENVQGNEKHIVLMSDGEFDNAEKDVLSAVRTLKKKGVILHGLGIGTREGAPVPNGDQGYIKSNDKMIVSRLDEPKFKKIIAEGNGRYVRANYLNHDTSLLRRQVNNMGDSDDAQETQKTKYWEERFYVFLIIPLFCVLPFFRRGAVFPVLIALGILMNAQPAAAFDWRDWFTSGDQRGQKAYEQGDFEKAAQDFSDPYNRGVAEYKAGQYEQAARSFTQSTHADTAQNVPYNLGNAQLMGGKIDDAIQTYEQLLNNYPDHKDATHNLEIARKLKEQQQNQDQQNQQDQNNQDKSSQNDETQDQEQDNKGQDNKDPQQDENSDQQNNAENNNEGDDLNEDQSREDETQDNDPSKDLEEQAPDNDKQPEQQQASKNQARSQEDIDADQWLNRIENNQEEFLRNKFYIESMRAKAKEGSTPW